MSKKLDLKNLARNFSVLASVCFLTLAQPALARGGGFGGGFGAGFAVGHGYGGMGVHGFSGGFTNTHEAADIHSIAQQRADVVATQNANLYLPTQVQATSPQVVATIKQAEKEPTAK